MTHARFTRRQALAGAAVTLGALALGRSAHAKGAVTAAMYPGTWEEAYRAHVAPALKKAHDVDLEMTPLFAVDQIAKAQAARGAPPFDAFVLDPGPRITAIDRALFEKFDAKRLGNLGRLLAGMVDDWGVTVAAQVVGIGYNPTLTGREITTFDDLLDPEFAGRVGMFSEMRDTMSLALLSIGVVPEEATIADVQAAQAKLLEAAQRGQFRAFYGNDYYDALAAGDVALTIAWSGDVSQMKLYDNPDVEFVVPETGGMLFVDNMAIPANAEHPIDAHMMMDFWYDLQSATTLTEYIGYFSPVNGVRDLVLQHAQEARDGGDSEWADALEVIAETSYPSADQLDNIYTYKILGEEEERQWNDLFNALISG